jgi:DNA-binding GntR family transcriptional regulator
MTPEWLARLEKRAREVDGVEPGDAFALHSDAFYDELYTPVSPVIARLSQSLRDELGLYWRGARVVGLGKGSHLALLRYVRAGDARGAGLWVERHLRTVAKEITAKLSSLDEHTGHGG